MGHAMRRAASQRLAPPLDPVATQIAALTPQAWWRLGEASGTSLTDSGSAGATGTLSGTATLAQTGALTGDSNTALLLAGGSAAFSRISATQQQSAFGWIKTTDTDSTVSYDGDAALTLLGDTSGGIWHGFGVTGGKAQYRRFNNSAWQLHTGATTVNDGNWHMIGYTYNHTTLAVVVYVDGVADYTGAQTAHQNQGGWSALGRGYNAVDTFRGTIDEVAVFVNKVLTAQNFADLWSKSVTG